MDGAMKFVKGDAIAGIIIIAINMVGGIAIGTLQRGMSLGAAVERYSLLDHRRRPGVADSGPVHIDHRGLHRHARIVRREQGPRNDIINQVMNEPKALLITAVILAVFAVIPGFPTIVFAVLSAACAGRLPDDAQPQEHAIDPEEIGDAGSRGRDEPERPGPLVPGRRRDSSPSRRSPLR